MTRSQDHAPPADPGGFRNRPFVSLWVTIFLGFSQYHLLQPIVPLLVVALGGDAALVGLTALAFSVPSILVRPILGRAVDRRSGRIVLGLGSTILGLTAAIYAIPTILAIFVGRFAQGIGWAALNTGGYSLLARLAPADRRGEASGYYAVAPAVAQLLMPGLGIFLYLSIGALVPLAISTAAALIGLTIIWRSGMNTPPPRPPDRPPTGAAGGLTERSSILPMALEAVNAGTQSIFTFMMPVIVLGRGINVESLALYYPAYGLVMVVARLLSPRMSDRMGREPTLVVGSIVALVAVTVGGLATTLPLVIAAGCTAAVSGALLTPTLSAWTIDRAPRHRIGAAMATYSLGYQVGQGGGGVIWGFAIAAIGTQSPFALAGIVQIVLIALLMLRARLRGSGPHASDRPTA